MIKMLFQHPWDKSVATTVDGDDVLAVLSPVTEEAPNERSRFEILSSKLQRSFHEKSVMLGEIQSLKNQLHYAMTTNSAIDAEREAWSRLVDSNVRSGIIACIWCMKAQVVKMTAMAFHKWKAYKILDIRIKSPCGENAAFDASDSNATAQAAAAAAQYFRHLMSQIPATADLTITNDSRSVTPDNSSCGEDSENIIRSSMITNAGLLHYSDSTLLSGIDSTVHSVQNGRIMRGNLHPRSLSKSPHRPQRYRLRSSSRTRVQDPLKEERYREGSVSTSRGEEWVNRIERGWSTERGRRREIRDINDNGININNSKNDHDNFENVDRTYRSRNENTVHTHTHTRTPNRNGDRREREDKSDFSPGFTHPHPLPHSHSLPHYRHVQSPLYMTPTASFASKLKILKPEISKRKPGMKAGSVSTSRTYDTNMNHNVYQNHGQRSHCFGSTYDTSQRTASGFITSNSALRDYREYGDDVREYEHEPCVTDDSPYVHDSPYIQSSSTSDFFKATRDVRDINKEKERGREKERNKDNKNSKSLMRNRSGSTELIRGNASIHVYNDNNDDNNDNHYNYSNSSYDNYDEKNFNIGKNYFQSTMKGKNTDIDINSNLKNENKHENESENNGSVYGYSNNYIRSNSLKLNKNLENNHNDDNDNNDYDYDRNNFQRMNSKEGNRNKNNFSVKQNKDINPNVHEFPLLYRTDNGRIRDRSTGRSRSSHRRGEGIGRGREEVWKSNNNNNNNNNAGEFSTHYGFLSWPTYGKGHGHGHGQDSGQSPRSSSPGGIYTMPNFKRYTDTLEKSRIN